MKHCDGLAAVLLKTPVTMSCHVCVVCICCDVVCWQILEMLGEVTIAVRTKALKCLTSVITVDPSVLAWVSSSVQTKDRRLALLYSLKIVKYAVNGY